MGIFASKEVSQEDLTIAVSGAQNCLENHRRNIHTLDSVISAQKNSLELLLQMLSDCKAANTIEQDRLTKSLETTQSLLRNIQEILSQQSGLIKSSFEGLDDCFQDVVRKYIPNFGSHGGQKQDSRVTNLNNPVEARSTLSYESECSSEASGMHINEAKCYECSKHSATLQAKSKELEKKIKECEDKNSKLTIEIRHNKEKTEELKKERNVKEDLEKKNKNLCKEIEQLKEEVRKRKSDENARYSLEMQLRRTEEDRQRLQQAVDYLESEKRKMKERKVSVPIQLYYQRKDDLMFAVVEELSVMLNTQMEVKNIQLVIERCEDHSSVKPDKPTLVLCINASRLGTDAGSAIEGVPKSGKTALLIFHHKNMHALPNHPSDRTLTSSEYKPLGGIFDLAFLREKGIYPCNMNNLALSGIESFICQNISG